MAEKGDELQGYNNELIRCLQELKGKRAEVERGILAEEEEKAKIVNDVRILNERLARLDESLARKLATKCQYDKTIHDTEAAYSKILESSQTLLHVLKRETVNIGKKK